MSYVVFVVSSVVVVHLLIIGVCIVNDDKNKEDILDMQQLS